MADLCLEYEVYDLQLWNSVLQKLVSFNMVSHMYITILLKLLQLLVRVILCTCAQTLHPETMAIIFLILEKPTKIVHVNYESCLFLDD